MSAPEQVENRLRVALHERAASVRVTPHGSEMLQGMLQRNHRRARLHWLAAGVATAAVVVLALTVVMPAVAHRAQPPTNRQPDGLGRVVGTAFLVHDDTAVFTVAGGSVWVANGQGNWNLILQQLDGATLHQSRSTPIGSAGNYPGGIAASGTSVWVTTSDGVVRRFDARTGQVTLTVHTASDQPGGVVIADGAVWVASTTSPTVLRLDPSSGRILARVTVGPPPASGTRPIVAAPTGLWVANGDGSLSRIDPATNLEVLRAHASHCCGGSIVVDPAGGLWVTDPTGAFVTHVEAASGRVLDTLPVDPNPSGLAVYDGAVWVGCRGRAAGAAANSGAVLDRIDYQTGKVAARVTLLGGVESLVATGSELVASDPTTSQLLIVRAAR